jgi:hypothetical protein
MRFFVLETPAKLPTVATVTCVREHPLYFSSFIPDGLIFEITYMLIGSRQVTVVTVLGFLRVLGP